MRGIIIGLLAAMLCVVSVSHAQAMQMTRYYGPPDLALLADVMAAGGGVHHFNAGKLVSTLAGDRYSEEVASLQRRMGHRRFTRAIATLTFCMGESLSVAQAMGVRLPPPNAALAHDGRRLSLRLYRAGISPTGRFDVGYMTERLTSRAVHVKVMHIVNISPLYGQQNNADAHILLSAVVGDLKAVYRE